MRHCNYNSPWEGVKEPALSQSQYWTSLEGMKQRMLRAFILHGIMFAQVLAESLPCAGEMTA